MVVGIDWVLSKVVMWDFVAWVAIGVPVGDYGEYGPCWLHR